MPQKLVLRVRRVQGVVRLARRLSALAPGPLGRVRIFGLALELGARWILRRPSGRLREIKLRGFGDVRTFALSDYGELQVIRDILLDEEYSVPAGEPATVVDLGANIGVASAWFRMRYPMARIVAVEPDPDTFTKLERNLGDDSAVTLVNAAVAARSGEVALFRPAGYSIASSLRGAPSAGEATNVRAYTLDELLADHGLDRVDLLKLDVEGAELDAVRGLSRLDAVRTIVGEVHPPLLADGVDAFFDALHGFDVERLSETSESITFIARQSDRAGVTTPLA